MEGRGEGCSCGFSLAHAEHIDLAVPAERLDGRALIRLPDLRSAGGKIEALLGRVADLNARFEVLRGLDAPDVILRAEGDKIKRLVLDVLALLEPSTISPEQADPLRAAIAGVLLPALAGRGFQAFGSSGVARVRDGALQVIVFDRSSYYTTDCSLHYNAVPLYRPNRGLPLAPPGAQLPGDWRFPVASIAEASMAEALVLIERRALPWLEQTATTKGLLQSFEASEWPSPEVLTFARACCLARLGRLDESAALLEDTRYPGGWLERSPGVGALRAAIREGTHAALQRSWVADSVAALKLTSIAGAET